MCYFALKTLNSSEPSYVVRVHIYCINKLQHLRKEETLIPFVVDVIDAAAAAVLELTAFTVAFVSTVAVYLNNLLQVRGSSSC